jgi:hypothetical protein
MKSLRLKRGKHNRSRKHNRRNKSRKLNNSSKLSIRKLRKGGNGNEESSSSSSSTPKVSLGELFQILYGYISKNRDIIYYEQYPNQTNENDNIARRAQREYYRESILNGFRNNRVDIPTISRNDFLRLVNNMLSINDQDIFTAFSVFCRNIKPENKLKLYLDMLAYKKYIQKNLYKDENYTQYNINKLSNLMEILREGLDIDTEMIKKASFIPEDKYPGRGDLITSTQRGLLPDEHVREVLSYLHNGYAPRNTEPTQHSTILNNAVQYANDNYTPRIKPDTDNSSSSDEKG